VCVEILQGGQTSNSLEGAEDRSSEGTVLLRISGELKVEEFAQEEGRQRWRPLRLRDSSENRKEGNVEAQEGATEAVRSAGKSRFGPLNSYVQGALEEAHRRGRTRQSSDIKKKSRHPLDREK
jgi:hypothetical protein